MRDLHQESNVAVAIGAATVGATTTPAAIDLAGYQGAEIVLAIGVGGITFTGVNKIDYVLTHSLDDATYNAVTDADVLGAPPIVGGVIKSLQAAHAAAAVYRYGYVGPRRYLKLQALFSGTHATGTIMAATVLRSYANMAPTADQQ